MHVLNSIQPKTCLRERRQAMIPLRSHTTRYRHGHEDDCDFAWLFRIHNGYSWPPGSGMRAFYHRWWLLTNELGAMENSISEEERSRDDFHAVLRPCSGQALRPCSGQALRPCSGQAFRLGSGSALARFHGWGEIRSRHWLLCFNRVLRSR